MGVTWLQRDARRREGRSWKVWLELVPQVRDEFQSQLDDDPFFYNETTSVSFLASVASRAKFLTLTDYSTTKHGLGKGRPHRNGRCDLWMAEKDGSHSWAFEFKQLFCRENPREGTFTGALKRASTDAEAIRKVEAEHRFGGLIVSAERSSDLTEAAVGRIEKLAERVDFSCKFAGGSGPVWLLLNQVRARSDPRYLRL